MTIEALKYDANKPPLGLIPRQALIGIADVLAFGAKKYAVHNWRRGMAWSRLADAALRHIYAWLDGEDLDPETGLSHLAHAATDLAFLITYQALRLGTDDRHTSPAGRTQTEMKGGSGGPSDSVGEGDSGSGHQGRVGGEAVRGP